MVATAWQIRESDPPPPYTEVAHSENAPPPSYFEVSNPPALNNSNEAPRTDSRLSSAGDMRNSRNSDDNSIQNNSGSLQGSLETSLQGSISHTVISMPPPWMTFNENRSDFTRNNSLRGSESTYSNEDGSVEGSEKKTIAAYCAVIGLSVFVIFAFWVYTTSANYDTSLFRLTPLDQGAHHRHGNDYMKPAVKYYPEIDISADELALYNITILP